MNTVERRVFQWSPIALHLISRVSVLVIGSDEETRKRVIQDLTPYCGTDYTLLESLESETSVIEALDTHRPTLLSLSPREATQLSRYVKNEFHFVITLYEEDKENQRDIFEHYFGSVPRVDQYQAYVGTCTSPGITGDAMVNYRGGGVSRNPYHWRRSEQHASLTPVHVPTIV